MKNIVIETNLNEFVPLLDDARIKVSEAIEAVRKVNEFEVKVKIAKEKAVPETPAQEQQIVVDEITNQVAKRMNDTLGSIN